MQGKSLKCSSPTLKLYITSHFKHDHHQVPDFTFTLNIYLFILIQIGIPLWLDKFSVKVRQKGRYKLHPHKMVTVQVFCKQSQPLDEM